MRAIYYYIAYYVLINIQRSAVGRIAPNALDIAIFTMISPSIF